jgi:hypothetical protein
MSDSRGRIIERKPDRRVYRDADPERLPASLRSASLRSASLEVPRWEWLAEECLAGE